jgi:hypothetical protein
MEDEESYGWKINLEMRYPVDAEGRGGFWKVTYWVRGDGT